MKIRKDFVTNSSSSCFIIVKNNKCTYKEIENEVRNHKTVIADFIHKNRHWLYKGNQYDKDIELALSEIATGIYDCRCCETYVDTDDFHIGAGNCSSEDSDLYENIIYNFAHIFNFPNLKISE